MEFQYKMYPIFIYMIYKGKFFLFLFSERFYSFLEINDEYII